MTSAEEQDLWEAEWRRLYGTPDEKVSRFTDAQWQHLMTDDELRTKLRLPSREEIRRLALPTVDEVADEPIIQGGMDSPPGVGWMIPDSTTQGLGERRMSADSVKARGDADSPSGPVVYNGSDSLYFCPKPGAKYVLDGMFITKASWDGTPDDLYFRVRYLSIPERYVLESFVLDFTSLPRYRYRPVFSGSLPSGLKCVCVRHDPMRRAFLFLVQHPDFTPNEEGMEIPSLDNKFMQWEAVEVEHPGMMVFNYPEGNEYARQEQIKNADRIKSRETIIRARKPGDWPAVEMLRPGEVLSESYPCVEG